MEIDYSLITALRKMQALSLNVNSSSKIEKPILVDEFDDEEFLEFAIENYSEMFEYINTGRVTIRIHRDIEGPSDKQDVIWGGIEIIQHKSIDDLLQKC